MKSRIVNAIVALGFAAAAAAAAGGCSSSKAEPTPVTSERTGSAAVKLVIPGGFNLSAIQVFINGSTKKTFTVDASQGLGTPQADGTIAIDLGTTSGLAPGSYIATISAVSSDGTVPCAAGAAPFAVTASAIATVTVFASCRTQARDSGSAAVGADFYDCGRVNSLADSVGEAMVGQSIPITGSVSGLNPAALKWSFSLSDADGTFAPLTGSGPTASTTFTCTRPGTVTIWLSANDGAVPLNSSGCSDIDSKSITVVCDLCNPPSSSSASSSTGSSSGGSSSGGSSTTATRTSSSSTSTALATGSGSFDVFNFHCVGNNAGSFCTPTEQLFIMKDTNPDGTGKSGMTAFGCYDCLANADCLDDRLFAEDVDHECGDTDCSGITRPALSGDSVTASCLGVISCVLGGGCATGIGSGNCYCGSAVGSSCVEGTPNGPCVAEEQDGADSTDPKAVNERFTDRSYAAGMANAIFSCAGANACTQCFP